MRLFFRVVVVVACLMIKECVSVQVDVPIQELLVLPGQNATYMCRVGVPLQYCRVEIPGLGVFNLNKKLSTNEVMYSGEGLDAGQCGFTVNRVSDRNNGLIRCSLGMATESAESVGKMQLIVAKAPKAPELDLSRGTDSLRVYKINDILQASCIVKDGRPVANITWYLDDQRLDGSDLSMPTVVEMAKENLQSKLQNLTRQLQASDNGKHLRCVAYHPAYPQGRSETYRELDVKYAPLAQADPIDKFGYTIGDTGVIRVDIEANPKPQIEWAIDGQRIKEGGNDHTGRIEAEAARDLGRGKYEVNLRIARINKQDTEKEYVLTAYNNMGNQNYRIKISTSPEPEGLEMGIGGIIGIVVGCLIIILIVSMLIFAKATGRWCFTDAGRESRNLGESSDTESTDVPRSKTLSPIKLTAFFRKTNKDKIAVVAEEAPKQLEPSLVDEAKQTTPPEGLVYAELDLVSPKVKPLVKSDDEKTEYAEIVYTTKEADDGNEEEKKKEGGTGTEK